MDDYYDTYKGHRVAHLLEVLRASKKRGDTIIYLAGDSSLDNKFWLEERVPPAESYRGVVASSKPDVCHWMNMALEASPVTVINCAVEEAALSEKSVLLPQDEFIVSNISHDDVLIVSIGGNDLALKSTVAIKAHMTSLILAPLAFIEWNPSFSYFVNYYRSKMLDYLTRLTRVQKPRLIVVSGIYFPCVKGSGWADTLLSLLGYNSNPDKLQAITRLMFSRAFDPKGLEGTEVVYVPLYDVLDPNNIDHYVARVEPSTTGGRLIAENYVKILRNI